MFQESMLRTVAPHPLKQAAPCGEFAIECIHRTAGEGRFEVPRHIVGMALGPPHRAEFAIGSDKRKRLMMQSGDIQMMPANLSHWVAWDRADFVLLQLAPELMAEAATELVGGRSVEIMPRLQIWNPLIEQIVLALRHEAETCGSGGRLYAEALVTVLSVQLIRHAADLPLPPAAKTTGRLPRATAHRVADYIEANLAGDLTLSELAGLAGMGRQHFGRTFKATFGRPPYQYVLARRLERARRFLAGTNLSIAEIAYAVGFSSQSHLTTTFHQRYGLTPRRYRFNR